MKPAVLVLPRDVSHFEQEVVGQLLLNDVTEDPPRPAFGIGPVAHFIPGLLNFQIQEARIVKASGCLLEFLLPVEAIGNGAGVGQKSYYELFFVRLWYIVSLDPWMTWMSF